MLLLQRGSWCVLVGEGYGGMCLLCVWEGGVNVSEGGEGRGVYWVARAVVVCVYCVWGRGV